MFVSYKHHDHEPDTGCYPCLGEGVTDTSFKGINPNCLIYLPEGFDGVTGDSLNVIINKAGSRVARADIAIDGKYAFNAPASFSLADHKDLSYCRRSGCCR